MSLRDETTLAGYARAAVDLKAHMSAYCSSTAGREFAAAFAQTRWEHVSPGSGPSPDLIDAIDRLTSAPWRVGEPFVLAPAMTAIVAAAADALDLTGEVLPADAAPTDFGALFLPEPIYCRHPTGGVSGVAALTWARMSTGARTAWAIAGWAERDNPHDPVAARVRGHTATDPTLRRRLGPYVLTDFEHTPLDAPVEPVPRSEEGIEQRDRDWEPALDGRYVIDAAACRTAVCTAIAYAFWRISAQPIATVARPPLGSPARRRAARACVAHDARVVMLRRVTPVNERPDGEARWHYRVRFVVRGHWRRLVDKRTGQPYRIWIHAFIKGPDGAPLLAGEKVAVLAR